MSMPVIAPGKPRFTQRIVADYHARVFSVALMRGLQDCNGFSTTSRERPLAGFSRILLLRNLQSGSLSLVASYWAVLRGF